MVYEISDKDLEKLIKDNNEENNLKEMTTDKFVESVEKDINQMVQPILYMRKAPADNSIINNIKNGEANMLHTAPITSSARINLNNVVARATEDKKFIDQIGPSSSRLSFNQESIAIEEFINYTIQNTIIGFCAMIDNTGDKFRNMVNNTRIKQLVYEELVSKDSYSIRDFIINFIYNRHNNSFRNTFSINNTAPLEETFDALIEHNNIIISQLDQLIFTKLCIGCDKSISEILLGLRVSPNLKYIVDAGIEYFKLDTKSIPDIKYEVYYRLNTTLVSMLNKFMVVVVHPMVDNLIRNISYFSYYYIFGTLSDDYYIKKYDNENAINTPKSQDNIQEVEVYDQPFPFD